MLSASPISSPTDPVVVVGNPGSRRLALFGEALARAGRPPARVVSYLELLRGTEVIERHVGPGTIVRIDSPGQDFAVERELLAAGADVGEGTSTMSRAAALALAPDRGRILHPRQWFLGFRALLGRLAEVPGARFTSHPDEIAVMFDKPACHARLGAAGVPVPEAFGPARSHDELRATLAAAGVERAFVKLSHGSSASGVVALSLRPGNEYAITSAELVEAGTEVRLYNSRRLRKYVRAREIAAVLDALCREGVHVERWLPKAGLEGGPMDVRVVTIGGRPRHAVPRIGRGPITNLHLLNRRGDPRALVALMGEDAWGRAREVCAAAARAFPRALHAGIDLLLEPGFSRCFVLEVNAFGDLLPGALDGGQDTYDAELAELAA